MSRSTIPFLIAVFVVAVGGTFLALQLFGGGRSAQDSQRVQLVTVPVIVTATTDANATVPVIIITATFDRTQIAVPTSVLGSVEGLTVIPPTFSAEALAANPSLESTQLALPQNCILHTVASGEAPFAIAANYSANPFLLLEVNGLTEESSRLLQIGDVLIVPLAGCPVEQLPNYRPNSIVVAGVSSGTSAAPTPTPNPTDNPDITPTVGASATITLAPTAQNAQIQVVGVEKAGDVTAEGVRIRNTGSTINVRNWTISDAAGNTFTFGDQLIFSNTEITVYTRVGQNTAIALYWGRDTAVWGDPNAVITIRDAQGRVQATVRMSGLRN